MKEHPTLKGYFVTEDGRVLSAWKRISNGKGKGGYYVIDANRKKHLKSHIEKKGYESISIKNKNYRVHRLVAETYIPNPECKPQVNHKNKIRSDNRVENLEWMTCKENLHHARATSVTVTSL